MNTRVGTDVSIEDLEKEFDAILWALGCQTGRALPVPAAMRPTASPASQFLEAFNKGALQVTADQVVCVGGGDTSIDVVSVARRLGKITKINKEVRPEQVIGGMSPTTRPSPRTRRCRRHPDLAVRSARR